jgi:ribonuclease HII
MVICGISFQKSKLDYLLNIGVKDSKKLTPSKRTELTKLLKQNCHSYKLIIVQTHEIDERITKKITLNRLEELKMVHIINELQSEEIYIDAADVNAARFGASIRKLLNYNPKLLISEHKADYKYPIVSAASIMAKHKRDSIVGRLREQYGDFGSGYTSDKKTIEFLRDWISVKKRLPPFVRKSWETCKTLVEELIYNKKVTDYF